MAIVKQQGALYSSAPNYFGFQSAGEFDDKIELLYNLASSSGFHDYDLIYGLYDEKGNRVSGQTNLGHYNIPPDNSKTGADFIFQLGAGAISDTEHAAFFTIPGSANSVANQTESIAFQEFNNSGKAIGGLKTLRVDGSKTIRNLYSFSLSSGVEFGHAFTVGYSTFDPKTGRATIRYERYTDSGVALGGGSLKAFADGGHHTLIFGSNYSATNPNSDGKPNYILLDPSSGGKSIEAEILAPNLKTVLHSTTFRVAGPGGQSPYLLGNFRYLRPGAGSHDNFAMYAQSFEYMGAGGNILSEIELEKVNAKTLKVEAKVEFANDYNAGVSMQHLNNGDILALYRDNSGQSYLREFDTHLHQVGAAFALPRDNDGFDSFTALGNDKFEIFWRQEVQSGGDTKYIQHHALYDADTSSLAAAHHHG